MAFYKNTFSTYSTDNAKEALGDEKLLLTGRYPEKQVKFVDDKPTKEVSGLQIWVATESHNPFKVKLPADASIDLSDYHIGDIIEFENLEAIEFKSKIYFRATSIKKGK